MNKLNKPLVKNGMLAIDGQQILVGSSPWTTWLCDHDYFAFEGQSGHFTAQRELRRDVGYWYAYRRRDGKLLKSYLGKAEALTAEHLEHVCAQLSGHSLLPPLGNELDENGLTPGLIVVPDGYREAVDSTDVVLPLIKTKPPLLPEKCIVRTQLIARIKAPVTLICAPTGFGK